MLKCMTGKAHISGGNYVKNILTKGVITYPEKFWINCNDSCDIDGNQLRKSQVEQLLYGNAKYLEIFREIATCDTKSF